MIRRKSIKDDKQYQSLSEDSFTNKKGIDVTQAPPMRDFVYDVTNLDVNLDGSMSLRKPLKSILNLTRNPYVVYELYPLHDSRYYARKQYTTTLPAPRFYINDNEGNNLPIKIRYKDTLYNFDPDNPNGVHFTDAVFTSTHTSTVISNVDLNLDMFLGGITNPLHIKYNYFNIVSAYFRLVFEEIDDVQTAILEYVSPYVATITNVEGKPSFNPNTAGYYTYALKDNYLAGTNSVNGILSYLTDSSSSADLPVAFFTETSYYGTSVVNTLANDFSITTPLYLKAFLSLDTDSYDYICSWEHSSNGVDFDPVNTFIKYYGDNLSYSTIPYRTIDESRINESTSASTPVYRPVYGVNLNCIKNNTDIVNLRPDFLRLYSNYDRTGTYYFKIFKLERSIVRAINTTISLKYSTSLSEPPTTSISTVTDKQKLSSLTTLPNFEFTSGMVTPLDISIAFYLPEGSFNYNDLKLVPEVYTSRTFNPTLDYSDAYTFITIDPNDNKVHIVNSNTKLYPLALSDYVILQLSVTYQNKYLTSFRTVFKKESVDITQISDVNLYYSLGKDFDSTKDNDIVTLVSEQSYNFTFDDTSEFLNEDKISTAKGEKLYYKYKLYSYGDPEFKNNIYVSDSNSFITSLFNTIELPMAKDSKVTALIPWREYLIAASETGLYLITPQSENYYTTKIINTFIGIPSKDRNTAKSILNGIIFKSGTKIYSVQPNMYSSDDSILNIIDISKPVAPYIVDTDYDNFAFTTEQFYYLCIPNTNSTTVLKYEYATRIWTKHLYPVRFNDTVVNTVDDIRIITPNDIYKFNSDLTDYIQYGDELQKDVITPFDFYLDTGQKSYNMNLIKQYVESKLIFAVLDDNDTLPITVDIYVDQFRPVLHIDPSTSSAYWKNIDTSLTLGSSVPILNTADTLHPVIKQMFLRYSSKGFTIRHVISGKSHSQFKFYVSYYRYKSTINKH